LEFLVSEFFSLFLMSANSSVAGNDERDQHLPAKILCGYVVDGPNLHGPFFIGPACYDYLLYRGLFEREFILPPYGLLARPTN
jgi:hypothetical protein